jgi:hypothetical protein
MYFCQKIVMKKYLYAILFSSIVLLGSCGIYNKPCEGVVQMYISNPNS